MNESLIDVAGGYALLNKICDNFVDKIRRRRYHNRPLAHGMDGDGLSYSAGATLVQSRGHVWNVAVRVLEINRVGAPRARHSLSATPRDWLDVQVSHRRAFDWGVIDAGLGYRRIDDNASGTDSDDVAGFIQWSLQ